jgi:hypothetical protein
MDQRVSPYVKPMGNEDASCELLARDAKKENPMHDTWKRLARVRVIWRTNEKTSAHARRRTTDVGGKQ